jgi:hypothetical protein
MPESKTKLKPFRWKWVGIMFLSYITFYFLPLFLFLGEYTPGEMQTNILAKFHGGWRFAGILVITAILGFISKDITMKETIVATLSLFIIILITALIKIGEKISYDFAILMLIEFFISFIIYCCLALAGTWWGKLIQRSGRKM